MNNKYLLDTNICVFILRKKHNLGEYISKIGIENCYISEITIAELLYGAQCSSLVQYNTKLVEDFCSDINSFRIENCLSIFAKEKARLRQLGQLIDDFDLLIGCTAIKNNCILVTDNVKHFQRLPLIIENWVKNG